VSAGTRWAITLRLGNVKREFLETTRCALLSGRLPDAMLETIAGALPMSAAI
jgi:hypothetical protein